MLTQLKNFVLQLLKSPQKLSQVIIVGFLVVGTVSLAVDLGTTDSAGSLKAQSTGDIVNDDGTSTRPLNPSNPSANNTPPANALDAANCQPTGSGGVFNTTDLQDSNCVLSCLQDRQLEAQAAGKSITSQTGTKAGQFMTNFKNSFAGMLPGIDKLYFTEKNKTAVYKTELAYQTTKIYSELQYCLPLTKIAFWHFDYMQDADEPEKLYYQSPEASNFVEHIDKATYEKAYEFAVDQKNAEAGNTYFGTIRDFNNAYGIITRDIQRKQVEIAKTIERAITAAEKLDTATLKQEAVNTARTKNLQAYFAQWWDKIMGSLNMEMNSQGSSSINTLKTMNYGTILNKAPSFPLGKIYAGIEAVKFIKAQVEEKKRVIDTFLGDTQGTLNGARTSDPAAQEALDDLDLNKVVDGIGESCDTRARTENGGLNTDGQLDLVLVNQYGEAIDLAGNKIRAGQAPIRVAVENGIVQQDKFGNPKVLDAQGQVIDKIYADQSATLLSDNAACEPVLDGSEPIKILAGLAPTDPDNEELQANREMLEQNANVPKMIAELDALLYGNMEKLEEYLATAGSINEVVTLKPANERTVENKASWVTIVTPTQDCNNGSGNPTRYIGNVARNIDRIGQAELQYFGIFALGEFTEILRVQGDFRDKRKMIENIRNGHVEQWRNTAKELQNAYVDVAQSMESQITASNSEGSALLTSGRVNALMAGAVVGAAMAAQPSEYSLGLVNLVPEGGQREKLMKNITDTGGTKKEGELVRQYAAARGVDLEAWYVPDFLKTVSKATKNAQLESGVPDQLCDLSFYSGPTTSDFEVENQCFGYPDELSSLLGGIGGVIGGQVALNITLNDVEEAGNTSCETPAERANPPPPTDMSGTRNRNNSCESAARIQLSRDDYLNPAACSTGGNGSSTGGSSSGVNFSGYTRDQCMQQGNSKFECLVQILRADACGGSTSSCGAPIEDDVATCLNGGSSQSSATIQCMYDLANGITGGRSVANNGGNWSNVSPQQCLSQGNGPNDNEEGYSCGFGNNMGAVSACMLELYDNNDYWCENHDDTYA